MVFKFTILSDELDDFIRIIDIDSESTFFDLHNAILDSVNFDKNQLTSFFLCTDEWEKGQEITLIEMESSSEYDNLIMEETVLREFLDDEKQKILYVFDIISDRAFFIELSEIITGKNLEKPICTTSTGIPPAQLEDNLNFVYVPQKNNQTINDEKFYGDEDFDLEELDDEGFGDLNFEEGEVKDF